MGSMSFTADIQQLEPGSVIQLIEIDGTEFGMDQVLRFHAHNIQEEGGQPSPQKICPPLSGRKPVRSHPYELKGMELSSTGSQPTPTLSVGNVGNYVTALCLEYDDMVRAKVKIHTTLSKYLDAANWKTVIRVPARPMSAYSSLRQCQNRRDACTG